MQVALFASTLQMRSVYAVYAKISFFRAPSIVKQKKKIIVLRAIDKKDDSFYI